MSKKTKLASQFPSIYRIITEKAVFKKPVNWWKRLSNQSKLKRFLKLIFTSFFIVFLVILIMATLVLGFKVYQKSTEFMQLAQKRQKIESQINFWQSVLQKYPGYKDAYFKIAVLEYQFKDFSKARQNLKQALLLDPNYKDAINLEEILNKNYSAGFSSGF